MKHKRHLSASAGNTGGGLSSVLSLGAGAASASPWGAAISAIPSVYKLISGIGQKRRANRLSRNLVRPKYNPEQYNIPGEVAQNLNMANNTIIDPRLPGQTQIEDRLGANTANAIGDAVGAGTSSDSLQAISNIYGKQMDSENALGISAAENYEANVDQKRDAVSQALLTSATYKDRKFDKDTERGDKMFEYNENQPFQQRTAEISALTGAANQNVYGGLDSLSRIGSSFANGMSKRRAKKRAFNSNGEIIADQQDNPLYV